MTSISAVSTSSSYYFVSTPPIIELLSNSSPENAIIKAINDIPLSQIEKLSLEFTGQTTLGKKTALHLAIERGYDKLADIIIEHLKHTPEHLAAVDTFGDTPLHLAVRFGELDIAYKLVNELKEYPHLLLAKNYIAEASPLYMAITLGFLKLASNFVEQIGSKLGTDTGALKLCIERGFSDVALILINAHSAEEIASCDQLLHLSLEYPKKEISASLIDKLSKSPNRLVEPHDVTGKTPLQVALSLGFADVASHLIETVSEINPDLLTHETDAIIPSLSLMLNHGYLSPAEKYIKVLQHHPDFLFRKDILGDTPFIIAVKKGYLSIAKLLATALNDNRKLLSTRDYLSHTPLCIARKNGDIHMTGFWKILKVKSTENGMKSTS